ncbi:MAG: hypothetical protein JWM91_4005, partial [Rhodospirillales bacterium]|nr:hypothetical protein [Rhodospirillales bacterium]
MCSSSRLTLRSDCQPDVDPGTGLQEVVDDWQKMQPPEYDRRGDDQFAPGRLI